MSILLSMTITVKARIKKETTQVESNLIAKGVISLQEAEAEVDDSTTLIKLGAKYMKSLVSVLANVTSDLTLITLHLKKVTTIHETMPQMLIR